MEAFARLAHIKNSYQNYSGSCISLYKTGKNYDNVLYLRLTNFLSGRVIQPLFLRNLRFLHL